MALVCRRGHRGSSLICIDTWSSGAIGYRVFAPTHSRPGGRGDDMILAGRPAKILLLDTNVYFSKRLSEALKREGFEVNCSTQPSFALTALEYDPPTAIVCSTSMREMGALELARLIRADAKNSTLPVVALGDGSQRALMEAFQAGCDDYIDRSRPPAVIATHVRNIII